MLRREVSRNVSREELKRLGSRAEMKVDATNDLASGFAEWNDYGSLGNSNAHGVDSVAFMQLAAPHRWSEVQDFMADHNGDRGVFVSVDWPAFELMHGTLTPVPDDEDLKDRGPFHSRHHAPMKSETMADYVRNDAVQKFIKANDLTFSDRRFMAEMDGRLAKLKDAKKVLVEVGVSCWAVNQNPPDSLLAALDSEGKEFANAFYNGTFSNRKWWFKMLEVTEQWGRAYAERSKIDFAVRESSYVPPLTPEEMERRRSEATRRAEERKQRAEEERRRQVYELERRERELKKRAEFYAAERERQATVEAAKDIDSDEYRERHGLLDLKGDHYAEFVEYLRRFTYEQNSAARDMVLDAWGRGEFSEHPWIEYRPEVGDVRRLFWSDGLRGLTQVLKEQKPPE